MLGTPAVTESVENGETTKGRQGFGRKMVLQCGSVYKKVFTKGSASCPKAGVRTGSLQLRQMVYGVPAYIAQAPPPPMEYSRNILGIFGAQLLHGYTGP